MHTVELLNPYRDRRRNLTILGFASYDDYLNSTLWQQIRLRVIAGRPCIRCGRRATTAHHAAYDLETLQGANIESLLPACQKCHNYAEKHASTRAAGDSAERLSIATAVLFTAERGQTKRERQHQRQLNRHGRPIPFAYQKIARRKAQRQRWKNPAIDAPVDMTPRLVKHQQA